jgi:hypothetical protein
MMLCASSSGKGGRATAPNSLFLSSLSYFLREVWLSTSDLGLISDQLGPTQLDAAVYISGNHLIANMESIRMIPFCVPLTPSGSGESSGAGVVGTITLRGQSAIVWFGWGAVEQREEEGGDDNITSDSTVATGTGRPPMGSLSLSMPPSSTRKGPSSIPTPTSQLLGGSSEEDMMLGQQMSARLAKRIGWPIFVSCSFSGWNGDSGQSGASPALAAGFDDESMPAAMAEKEVTRILTLEKDKLAVST